MLSLGLIKHHAMNMYGEVEVSATVLHFGTRWMRVVSSAPLPPYPRGNTSSFPLDMRLDIMEKRKISPPNQESNSYSLVVQNMNWTRT
jgi:hypothetical protein